jgi:hypothetical protein
MKIFFMLLMTVSCFVCSEEPKIIVCSSPRSGTNLLCGSLCAIFGRPIDDFEGGRIGKNASNRLNYDKIEDSPFGYRCHDSALVATRREFADKLVMLTRSPLELFLRNYDVKKDWQSIKKDVAFFSKEYFSRFQEFENWNEEDRLLVFYEDLVSDFELTILKVIQFSGLDPVNLEDFLKKRDEKLNLIRKSYVAQHGNQHGNSSKSGPDIAYYSDQHKTQLVKRVISAIKEQNLELWERYLKRFELVD